MKYASIFLACLLGVARAQEEKPPEGEKPAEEGAAEEGAAEEEEEIKSTPPPEAPPEPMKIISDLTLANAVKDGGRIDIAAKQALAWSKGAKDMALIDTMSKELAESLKAVKGNWGTLNVIVEALGELRSKEGGKALKRIAFKKDFKDENEEKHQAAAIVALGKFADPKEIGAFEEVSKTDSKVIAKAAYTALGSYGSAKGKVRKQAVEVLMKRIDMEYPSSGGQGGKTVSAEKQERWNEVSPAIVKALQDLCRQPTIPDIDNWREWWKENKKNPKSDAWKDDDGDKES